MKKNEMVKPLLQLTLADSFELRALAFWKKSFTVKSLTNRRDHFRSIS